MKAAALLPLIALAALPIACSAPKAQGSCVDLVIVDALVVDGSGGEPFAGDVGVCGEDIAYVGKAPPGSTPKRIIDAKGRVVAPGFIDLHAHGDAEKDDFASFLAMGVTTIALGQDGNGAYDESAPAPAVPAADRLATWMEGLEAAGVQVNIVPISGHASLRKGAEIPDSVRTLDADQQRRMTALLEGELGAGSFGMSTGLEYVPGRYAGTAELKALGATVAAADGIILSHLRTEDDGLIQRAIQELVDYGGGARVHISHLKVVFGEGGATARQLLDFIAAKRREGARLSADIYPYTAGYTGLGIIFPAWALPPGDYDQVVKERRDELLDYLRVRMLRRGGPNALLIGSPPFAGKTLSQVAKEQGKPFEEVLLALGPRGGHGAHFIMDEALQDVLLASPITAISTDAAPDLRHPRATGTYARLIEHHVRAKGVLTLQEAIRKSSGLPASLLGLTDRGLIRPGAKADLLLFDPEKVRARSSYLDPFLPAEGFDLVVVNGAVVREHGQTKSSRHGRVLRRESARSRSGFVAAVRPLQLSNVVERAERLGEHSRHTKTNPVAGALARSVTPMLSVALPAPLGATCGRRNLC